jgi:hypothetical protein
MSQLSASDTPNLSTPEHFHTHGWEVAIESTLSVLREIQARFEQDSVKVRESARSGKSKTRALAAAPKGVAL